MAMRAFGFKGLFTAGLVAVVLGYLSLRMGSLTLAPLLLVAGYCLLIPSALFRLGHSDQRDPAAADGAGSRHSALRSDAASGEK